MKASALLSLGLLSSLQAATAVQLEINETLYADHRTPRVAIVDMPYIDDSVLPKDQPCPALPFSAHTVRLLVETLTVPTFCYLYSQMCHDGFGRIDNEHPFADHPPGSVLTVRCYVDD